MKNFSKILFISVLLGTILCAQTPDLILQKTIDSEYMDYLSNKENEFRAQIVPNSDDAQSMQAYLGLAIIQAVRVQIAHDTLMQDVQILGLDAISNAFSGMLTTSFGLEPIFNAASQEEFFNRLTEFFDSGDYPRLRDELKSYYHNIRTDFVAINQEIETFRSNLEYYGTLGGDYWRTVYKGTADFELTILVKETAQGDLTLVFSRRFFNHLHDIDRLGRQMNKQINAGFTYFDSVMEIPGGDVMPGVQNLRDGLATFQELTDTLEVVLTSQPLSPWQPSLNGVKVARAFIQLFDDMLAGEKFAIGPASEGKVIDFLALLQNMPGGGLGKVYEDFYRDGENNSYSFGSIFPNGIPLSWLDMIKSDLILNANDDFLVLKARLAFKKAQWLAMNPMQPDHHLGVALALLSELVTDPVYLNNLEQAFHYLQNGRIDSLTYQFKWEDFDISAQLKEIRYHLDQYIHASHPTNFVILEKYNDDLLNRYTITANSDFSITYITVPQVTAVVEMLSAIADGVQLINQAIGGLYRNLSEVLVLDLDPSYLNFSNINNQGDLILILEASNPDFLSLKPAGVEKFHEAGQWLTKAFKELNIFCDQLTRLFIAVAPYEDDFNINSMQLAFGSSILSYLAKNLHTDFLYPDSVTWIGNERINFSAWFDNPPRSFLQIWKAKVFGYDQRLGGMFPDRPFKTDVQNVPKLPREFALYPVYPNPFNPVAAIEFDLPKAADVRLEIINLQGQIVAQIMAEHLPAGHYRKIWDASRQPSGLYFAILTVNDAKLLRKMTLIK